jgi:hypothetical protein
LAQLFNNFFYVLLTVYEILAISSCIKHIKTCELTVAKMKYLNQHESIGCVLRHLKTVLGSSAYSAQVAVYFKHEYIIENGLQNAHKIKTHQNVKKRELNL